MFVANRPSSMALALCAATTSLGRSPLFSSASTSYGISSSANVRARAWMSPILL